MLLFVAELLSQCCDLMEQGRLIQPASRDQIVAIIRQRAERANRDLPAQLGQVCSFIISNNNLLNNNNSYRRCFLLQPSLTSHLVKREFDAVT